MSLDRQGPLTLWGKAFVLGGGGEMVFLAGELFVGSMQRPNKRGNFSVRRAA